MSESTQTADRIPFRRQAQPCLVVLTGAQKGVAYWLEPELVKVGRADDCEVKLDDASVSRYHAELRLGSESWLISDLDSKNGTFLSDRNVSAQIAIRDGDVCRFGLVSLQLFMVQSIQALQAESLHSMGLSLDAARMAVFFLDRSVDLTETEFRMLAALMRRPGRVLSNLVLMRAAYPREHAVAPATIASHVRNLRQKLADVTSGVEVLRSYYGRGYALEIKSDRPVGDLSCE